MSADLPAPTISLARSGLQLIHIKAMIHVSERPALYLSGLKHLTPRAQIPDFNTRCLTVGFARLLCFHLQVWLEDNSETVSSCLDGWIQAEALMRSDVLQLQYEYNYILKQCAQVISVTPRFLCPGFPSAQ